jgi:hypothetical protein
MLRNFLLIDFGRFLRKKGTLTTVGELIRRRKKEKFEEAIQTFVEDEFEKEG